MPDTPVRGARRDWPILAVGFRPLFLAAGLWAVLSLPVWLAMLHGAMAMDGYYVGTHWHAHELLFGYGLAVIAGFLLTAVRNWTGMATATGGELGALVLLWVLGRAAPLLPLPGVLVAALDLSFPALLAAALHKPLWHGPNPANRAFLALLGGMWVADILVHLQALGLTAGTALAGDRLMLGLIIVTLLVVAGRVMPFFTRTAIPGAVPSANQWVERLTFWLALPWVLGDSATQYGLPVAVPTAICALALALVQGRRLAGWHDPRVWGIPILAVLYLGYLWLILGLGLNALAHLGLLQPFPALHALTVGAIGVFTLGMMARVSLGHTGRAMVASGLTVMAFVALNLAALVRVIAPLAWPSGYGYSLMAAGCLWVIAFGLFLWVYAPLLVSRRADGQPG